MAASGLGPGLAQLTNTFPYEPLIEESEIRLLILYAGLPGSDIKCQVYNSTLAQNVAYEALSYAWGDPTETGQILLNGNPFRVTVNLEVALRHLRREREERTLWVDAICIDQLNVRERNRQVKKMWRIYKSAMRVLAWVGAASDDSDEAMDLVERVAQFMKPKLAIDSLNVTPQELTADGLDGPTTNWNAIWSLLHRPYWYRVWVLQELYFSGSVMDEGDNRCIVGCGNTWLPKTKFMAAYLFVIALTQSYAAFEDYDRTVPEGDVVFLEPIYSLILRGKDTGFDIFGALSQAEKSPSKTKSKSGTQLPLLMRFTKLLQASDPRDKVYGLLGMVGEDRVRFPVDYTESLEHVLKEAVEFSINASRDLTILEGNRSTAEGALPSWMPDWTSIISDPLSWSDSTMFFKASNSIQARAPRFDQSGNILIIEGVPIGHVREVIGPFRPKDNSDPDEYNAYTEELRRKMIRYNTTLDDEQRNKFWRALVLDRKYTNESENGFISPAPNEFASMHEVLMLGGAVPVDFMQHSPDYQRISEYTAPYIFSFEQAVANHCFFDTDTGYMGLGPFCTQPGDLAAVLVGSPLCSVLRPSGEQYRLLGDAYVHGVMEGNLLEIDEHGNVLNAHNISIC